MVLPITEAERIKRQMSRDDLANALSVSKRTISNWQSGVITFEKNTRKKGKSMVP